MNTTDIIWTCPKCQQRTRTEIMSYGFAGCHKCNYEPNPYDNSIKSELIDFRKKSDVVTNFKR